MEVHGTPNNIEANKHLPFDVMTGICVHGKGVIVEGKGEYRHVRSHYVVKKDRKGNFYITINKEKFIIVLPDGYYEKKEEIKTCEYFNVGETYIDVTEHWYNK